MQHDYPGEIEHNPGPQPRELSEAVSDHWNDERTDCWISLHALDPSTLYIWWEVPDGARRELQERPERPPLPHLVLRIIEVGSTWTDNIETIWESEVEKESAKHVTVPGAGRSYVAELGVRQNGTYQILVRSQPRITPWGHPSSTIDPEWPPLAPLYTGLLFDPGSSSLLHEPSDREDSS